MAATTADYGNSSSSDVVVGAEKSATSMIKLVSSDGEHFDVTKAAAGMSQTIAHMIEDGFVENGVPLPNVKSAILAKVIQYCNKHVVVETASSGNDAASSGAAGGDQAAALKSFDANFVKVDVPTLFEIIRAANYLNIKGLMDLTCQTVADMIKSKTLEEVREIFNVENDYTPEEEEEVRKENAWAFE